MSHSTLGDRWVYDACHDPVYLAAVTRAIVTGGREADLFMLTDAGLVPEVINTHVRGSGSVSPAGVPDLSAPVVTHHGTTTRIDAGVSLILQRVPVPPRGGLTLTGTWPGQETPQLLATVDARR